MTQVSGWRPELGERRHSWKVTLHVTVVSDTGSTGSVLSLVSPTHPVLTLREHTIMPIILIKILTRFHSGSHVASASGTLSVKHLTSRVLPAFSPPSPSATTQLGRNSHLHCEPPAGASARAEPLSVQPSRWCLVRGSPARHPLSILTTLTPAGVLLSSDPTRLPEPLTQSPRHHLFHPDTSVTPAEEEPCFLKM